jgi:hypothetical protein
MAMNKKEKEYLEHILTQFALRHTQEVLPDIPPPPLGSPHGTLTKGFLFNSYSKEVRESCSSSMYHSYHRSDKTNTQGARHLYSSRLLALKAMRYEVEQKYAKELREIDKLIEEIEEKAND